MLKPIATLMLTLALATPVAAAQPTSGQVPDTAAFAAKAAASNSFEIQSSQLALTRSNTRVVQFFARKMIDDHKAAAAQMKVAAEDQKVAVSAEVDPLQADELAELGKLKGKAFDTAYNEMQVMAHDQAVMLFQTYSDGGTPGPLQAFAKKTLPILRMHQTMIHTITGT